MRLEAGLLCVDGWLAFVFGHDYDGAAAAAAAAVDEDGDKDVGV